MPDSVREKISQLPREPGVYLFRNKKGRVIYVGKAKSLKNRVASYFTGNLKLGTKTQALISGVADLEVVQTMSEVEALLLEAELIKRYKPKYNIAHKDDKSRLYIVMRKDMVDISGKKVKLTKIVTVRKTDLKKTDLAFGPYANSSDARTILRIVRKVFPYRDCSLTKFNRYKRIQKPCLYGHLGLCQAPCLNRKNIGEYKKDIRRIKKFLSGGGSKIIKEYEREMKRASKGMDYEKAGYYRDLLKKFAYIRTSFKSTEKYIENPNLLEDLAREALDELVENLEIINSRPRRIECYDISNISGKEAVGSMVVAENGQINKHHYRRFKIKLKDDPDDYHMMREVLSRRLRRVIDGEGSKSKWQKPDLIILDGGKGQVSIGEKVLKEMGLNIPLLGIAKKKETIVYISAGVFKEVNLSHDNDGLKLLINLRDEAHRFAQVYHHYLRLKKIRV